MRTLFRRWRTRVTDDRWLVVGLGNPDPDYRGTRHNVGAEVVGVVADRFAADLARNKRVRCAVAEVRDGDARLVLARPLAYMNESGRPVQSAAAWYRVPTERLVVIHDDLDLEIGTLRLKQGGGHAGHNGLRDLDRHLGTRDYHRVRIGIGRPPGRMDPSDHVLRPFTSQERRTIDVVVEEAADAVLSTVREGLDAAQNRYHTR